MKNARRPRIYGVFLCYHIGVTGGKIMITITLLFLILVIVLTIIIVKITRPKTTSDVTLQKVDYMDGSRLENFYDQPIDNPSWDEVYLRIRKIIDRFETFYRCAYVDNLGEFKPVEFFK